MASKLGVINLPRKGRSRQGIAIVVALAAITVVVGMLIPLIPPALRARRQCEADEVALQAEMLRHAAFQYGILRWSPDQEAMEESGTLSFGDEASNPESLKRGAWKIEIRRLSEGARYRVLIVAKISGDSLAGTIQSSSEMEISRIEIESHQKRLLQYANRNQTSPPNNS